MAQTTNIAFKMRRPGVDVKYHLQWFGLNHFIGVQSCFPLVPTPCRYEAAVWNIYERAKKIIIILLQCSICTLFEFSKNTSNIIWLRSMHCMCNLKSRLRGKKFLSFFFNHWDIVFKFETRDYIESGVANLFIQRAKI